MHWLAWKRASMFGQQILLATTERGWRVGVGGLILIVSSPRSCSEDQNLQPEIQIRRRYNTGTFLSFVYSSIICMACVFICISSMIGSCVLWCNYTPSVCSNAVEPLNWHSFFPNSDQDINQRRILLICYCCYVAIVTTRPANTYTSLTTTTTTQILKMFYYLTKRNI